MTNAHKHIQLLLALPERDMNFYLCVYLSGDHNRYIRQEIMSELKGVKVPIAKSGITAIQHNIMESELWQLGEKLRAIGMEDCQTYSVQVEIGVWKLMRFHYMHEEKGFYPNFTHNKEVYSIMPNKGNVCFKDRNNVIHNF